MNLERSSYHSHGDSMKAGPVGKVIVDPAFQV
jgi:hypothetical protein